MVIISAFVTALSTEYLVLLIRRFPTGEYTAFTFNSDYKKKMLFQLSETDEKLSSRNVNSLKYF